MTKISKRDRNWQKILEESSISKNFSTWLDDTSSIYFEIPNEVIKEIGARPGKTIPLYHKREIPTPLKEYNLELFRHKLGSCVITKTGNGRILNSVFPDLPECEVITTDPFRKISPKSLLLRREHTNEEHGFFVAQRTGVLADFLNKIVGSVNLQKLEHCGRFQGNVSSSVMIDDNIIDVVKANYEIDHVLENDDLIVLLELKMGFHTSHSLHQLILPYLELKQYAADRPIICIYFETNSVRETDKPKFRLYHLDVIEENGVVSISRTQYRNANEYIISVA